MKKNGLFLLTTAILTVAVMPLAAAGAKDEAYKKEGQEQVLHLAYNRERNTYNSYDFVYPWTDTNLIGNLMWLTLLQADNKLKVSGPEIMKNWEIKDNGCTIVMTIRKDLKWSDGKPITMDDVTWTLGRMCKDGIYWAYVTNALKYIEGFEDYKTGKTNWIKGIQVNGDTLTIKLTAPYVSFVDLMCQVAPLPKHIYENCAFENNGFKTDPIWRTIPVNSGMFVIKKHVPGSYYILEPNPYYKDKTPKIKKILCTVTSDFSIAARSGITDFFMANDAETYHAMQKTPGFELKVVPTIFFRFLLFNFFDAAGEEKNIIGDWRTRKAIAMAVDWNTVIKGLYGEQASLTQTGVLSSDKNYAGDWYKYDPQGAKTLLQQAGYNFNHILKIYYYYKDQTSIDVMDAIAYYLGQIGVKCEAVYTSNPVGDVFEGRKHDLAYFGLSAYDNLSWYQMYLRENMNWMIPARDLFKDEVAKLEQAYTPKMVAAQLAVLQKMDRDNAFFLPVYTVNQQIWKSSKLSIPENTLGNFWFFFDYKFEEWEIK